MGITVYKIEIKDIQGEKIYSKEINHSSLLAYITLGIQLYKLRKSEKVPAFCSIECSRLG